MNEVVTGSDIVSSPAVVDLTALHQDPPPAVAVPPPAVPASSRHVTVGRVRRHVPQVVVPTAQPYKVYEAKRLIIDGLAETLRQLSQLPEDERRDKLSALVRGSSLTGFVRTNRGQRVDSIDALRSLVYALNHLTVTKTFDNGNRLLFFFTVPRGYRAYAGEVRLDPLIRYYLKKDRKLQTARQEWLRLRDAAVAAGQDLSTLPPEVAEPQGFVVTPNGSKHGPWVHLVLDSTKLDVIETPVVTPHGVKMEFSGILINNKVPMHQARTLTFVVDQPTRQLVAWQSGRYVAEMTPTQRAQRVILSSGDTIEDEV